MSANSDHSFHISRAKNAEFSEDQFRDWLISRDLGLAKATAGTFGGQITRAKELGHSTGRHFHSMTFQIVYVLKGWVKFWYEGQGEFVFNEGDFVYHPPAAAHDLKDYSEDMELLEIYAPAAPDTIDINNATQ